MMSIADIIQLASCAPCCSFRWVTLRATTSGEFAPR